MLFLLVMEILNALIQKVFQWSLFTPLGLSGIKHLASFYADDLVWFIMSEGRDLSMVGSILSLFEDYSGLSYNLHKCQLAPIRCSPDQVNLATSVFPWQLVNFPVKYLGMPLAVAKLPHGGNSAYYGQHGGPSACLEGSSPALLRKVNSDQDDHLRSADLYVH
jgi:hypothetical protein